MNQFIFRPLRAADYDQWVPLWDSNNFGHHDEILTQETWRRILADDEPVFGAPVFVYEGNQLKHRVVREYSAEVSTRCNYDDLLELIIFDHFIEQNGTYGEGPVNYPDGSYEAYRLQGGLWWHVDKVFDQVSDEAPRPAPILDHRTKDIFGKQ